MEIVPISELDILLGYTCSKASSPKKKKNIIAKNSLFEFCKDSLKEFILNESKEKC